MVDVAELLHGQAYDPVKAHAYYERTKRLKGRTPGALVRPSVGSGPRQAAPHRAGPAHSQSHDAQRAALEARIEHLKEVLRAKVAEAKQRSGVKEPSSSSSSSSSSKSGGSKKSSSSTKSDSSSENLTPSQRNEKNRKAREAYKKEKPPSISELQAQIKSIRRQIQAAIEQSRKRHAASSSGGSHQTADSRR